MTIRAIETRYKDYRFRSRLEARWAVFFDTLGVPWEYERQGYNLGSMWPAGSHMANTSQNNDVLYLPDFWIRHLGIWVEIKADRSKTTSDDWGKIFRLARQGEKPVFVLEGNIGDHKGVMTLPGDPITENPALTVLIATGAIDERAVCSCIEDVEWAICPICTRLCLAYEADEDYLNILCAVCSTPSTRVRAKYKASDPRTSEDLLAAYIAARSARFEYGETPKVPRGKPKRR